MSRLVRTVVLVAGVAACLALGAAAAPARFSPHHDPPWLVSSGQAVTLAYDGVNANGERGTLPPGTAGAVYVRNGRQQRFTRLPLAREGGGPLVAHVPAALVSGDKLLYYAVLRDPTGRSISVPAGAGRSPERVWIVDHLLPVPLGTHQFGHLRAPDAVVARAGAKDVGFPDSSPNGGCGCGDAHGPLTFDVARDGSTWLFDQLNRRLLVWRSGRAAPPLRRVELPHNLDVRDFAVGRDGTIYLYAVEADPAGGDHPNLWALTPGGRVRWQASADMGDALRIGPDGSLFTVARVGPYRSTWTPLTTPAGRPLPPAEQRRRTSPFQPLPGGLRLATMWVSPREVRLGLIDRADEVVRAWRITSRTKLEPVHATPTLVGGDPVVPLDVYQGRSWEHLVLRLAPGGGTRQRLALSAAALWGDDGAGTPLRVGPDGRLYQLRSKPTSGVSIARYSLG